MKKVYRLLFVLISMVIFCNSIYAEDEEFDVTNTDAFKETQLYCKGEAWNVKGCYYDRRNPNSKIETITNVKKIISVNPGGYNADSVQIKSASLKQAYTIFNKDKKAIEGLCYHGYVNSVERGWNGIYKYEMVSKKDSEHTIEAFYLTVVGERLGKCNTLPNKSAIVFNTSDGKLPFNYNWKKDGVSIVGYNGYKSGSCPKYFNYMNVSGVAKLTDPDLEYTFSDNPSQKHDMTWIGAALSNAITTGSFNGCTDKDEESTESAIECFDKEVSSISSMSCDNIKNYTKTSEAIIKSCANNSDHKAIQSQGLEDYNMKTYSEKLSNAVSERMMDCLYVSCGFSEKANSAYETTVSKLKGELKNANCSTGTNKYFCANDDSYQKCLECAKNVYSKYGTKGQCVVNGLEKTQEEIKEATSEIENQGNNVVEDNVNESSKQRVKSAQSSYAKFDPPEINGGIFGRGGSCSQILGTNGIKILKGVITTVRIVAPIIAIINAMIILLPAVTSKDADGLKKASSKCVKLAVILAVIEIFPSVIKLIGALFGWDTCGI